MVIFQKGAKGYLWLPDASSVLQLFPFPSRERGAGMRDQVIRSRTSEPGLPSVI